MFFDGASVDTSSVDAGTIDADNARIGAVTFNGSSSGYFNGLIDDVIVYDNALSDDELNMLYNAYDAAGNLTRDHRGYTYVYDYENRIAEIKLGPKQASFFRVPYFPVAKFIRAHPFRSSRPAG